MLAYESSPSKERGAPRGVESWESANVLEAELGDFGVTAFVFGTPPKRGAVRRLVVLALYHVGALVYNVEARRAEGAVDFEVGAWAPATFVASAGAVALGVPCTRGGKGVLR